jgi:hypothetical protein
VSQSAYFLVVCAGEPCRAFGGDRRRLLVGFAQLRNREDEVKRSRTRLKPKCKAGLKLPPKDSSGVPVSWSATRMIIGLARCDQN